MCYLLILYVGKTLDREVIYADFSLSVKYNFSYEIQFPSKILSSNLKLFNQAEVVTFLAELLRNQLWNHFTTVTAIIRNSCNTSNYWEYCHFKCLFIYFNRKIKVSMILSRISRLNQDDLRKSSNSPQFSWEKRNFPLFENLNCVRICGPGPAVNFDISKPSFGLD